MWKHGSFTSEAIALRQAAIRLIRVATEARCSDLNKSNLGKDSREHSPENFQ
jgi:hypothetical protein